jgi:hypothetical protein
MYKFVPQVFHATSGFLTNEDPSTKNDTILLKIVLQML